MKKLLITAFSTKGYIIMLFTIIILITLRLGFWQISRMQEKQLWLDKEQQQPNINLTTQTTSKIFLLDQQIFNKQLGYKVLHVAIDPKKQCALLVDRGFLKAPITNKYQISPLSENLNGKFYKITQNFELKAQVLPENPTWPLIIQNIKPLKLERLLDVPICENILQLAPSNPETLIYQRRVLAVKPTRHLGYAVQWFLLSLLSFIYCCILVIRQRSRSPA